MRGAQRGRTSADVSDDRRWRQVPQDDLLRPLELELTMRFGQSPLLTALAVVLMHRVVGQVTGHCSSIAALPRRRISFIRG